MSVYDFNHHEQLSINSNNNSNSNDRISNSNNVAHNSINGSQSRYQADNDYLGRSFASSHPMDHASVQLTRPTSKTAMYVRQRRAMLEQLSCYLCQGYIIDATTVDECMDSFCKSCIILYLRTHNDCPKCGTLIHKTNPLSAIRSDKVLQDIVYKLVPGLYDDEMKRRRDYYRNLIGSSSSEDDDETSSGSINGINPMHNSEKYGIISHPKQFYKPTDSIDLSIEPQTRGDSSTIYYDNRRQSIVTCFTGNIQQQQLLSSYGSLFSTVDSQQFKTYLRCPAKLTALQLKKFIAAKFNICRDDTIHVLYLNESLKDVYSLIDIAYIYDWRGTEHMRLFYIIERDLSNFRSLPEPTKNQTHKTVSRQTVGTSTQTVKRVCIDPHPKYYEVQSGSPPSSTNGRSMRSRDESQNGDMAKREVGVAATGPSQMPILRSGYPRNDNNNNNNNNSSQISRSVATSTNLAPGFKSRELVNLGAGAQGARQSQFTDAVTTAIDELSRLKQDAPKETRSTRKIMSEGSATRSIPKININLGTLDRSQGGYSTINKSGVTYSKIGPESSNVHSRDINSNQVVSNHQATPYYRQIQATQTSLPQSSLVTLASFTQAQNNHIVAVSHSTTTSISSGGGGGGGGVSKNFVNSAQQQQQAFKSDLSRCVDSPSVVQPIKSQSNHGPQLAFSIVTERGITIVRRNNPDGSVPVSTSSMTGAMSGRIGNPYQAALPAPPETCATNQSSSYDQSSLASHSNSPTQSAIGCGGGIGRQQSSSSASSAGGSSPRNHLKAVKPVYKVLVDPSKIKSPNYKKLGTARH